MNVKIFDTHVRTRAGRYLHFDVVTAGGDNAQASQIASDWLTAQGMPADDIQQSHCQYCHSEIATPAVVEAINTQGYYIITLQGF
ncbi:DUF2024 family protein [Pseudomonas turukhanskensis]|uniref:DUF2024 domain-containing protein n=1 Tax=Pseudomonas turukhanskensis TaxID=1806536 RepID=A0A9W6K811_9PSED|nr:DUF2024 family protein [Pseudomonas turukhanskensis]GLK89744.1 hypothetical protein GCM10017655_28060 [Pseudomonas turukhanskensis]